MAIWANLQDEKTLKLMVAVFAVYVVGFVMIYLACSLTIVISHVSFTLSVNQQQRPDPSGDQLAAEILRAVKANLGEEKGE